jgi:hypothetical protein
MRRYSRGWCGLSWLGLAAFGLGVGAFGAGAAAPVPIPNASFEEWEPLATPLAGWELGPALSCPQHWLPQERPDEPGYLRRMANPPADRERFGEASLFLDGRILMAQPLTDVRDKTLEIAFWAKGENASVAVRLFEYTSAACAPLDFLADVAEVRTDGEWREYSSLVTMWPCHGAGFAKIEVHGRGVRLDTLRVALVDTGPGTSAPAAYQGTWTIPLLARPPLIDGRLDATEWAGASGSRTGFMNILTHSAIPRQTEIRVAADATTLYLLALFDVRPNGHKNTITQRDGNVWEDESLEIIINPEFGQTDKPSSLYQLVLNLGGTVFDLASRRQLGLDQAEWTCDGLQVRSVAGPDQRPGLEIAIPLAAVGLEAGKPFGLNLCRNLYYPAQFASITGLGYKDCANLLACTIAADAPAVLWGYAGRLREGSISLAAAVRNVTGQEATYRVMLSRQGQTEQRAGKDVPVAAGAEAQLTLPEDETRLRVGELRCEVRGADGRLWFSQPVHFSTEGMADVTSATGTAKTHDLEYYPVQQKIALRLFGMQARLAALGGKAYGRTDVAILQGSDPRTARPFAALAVDPPVVVQDMGCIAFPFAPEANGEYIVRAAVHDAAGTCLEVISGTVEKKDLPWLGNSVGKDRIVIAPFTPLQVGGSRVGCWGREYTFAGSGLPERIVSQGEDVLAAPMRLVLEDATGVHADIPGTLTFAETATDRVRFGGETRLADLAVTVAGTLDYDGGLLYSLTLTPARALDVTRLSLEVPLRDLTYFHSSGNSMTPTLYMMAKPESDWADPKVQTWTGKSAYRNRYPTSYWFPAGEGLLWSSLGVTSHAMVGNFLPYLLFGNRRNGLCWYANSDRGWAHDETVPCTTITREKGVAVVRLHVIAKPTTLSAPRTVVFGLIATPTRPRVVGGNSAFKVGDLGFGNPFVRQNMGIECRDFFLAREKYTALKATGEAAYLYMAGETLSVGDPVVRDLAYEWGNVPLQYYALAQEAMAWKGSGGDALNYTGLHVAMSPSRVDYSVLRVAEWIEKTGLTGLYLDNSFPYASTNVQHADGAYRREDGRVQGAYRTFETRDLIRRCAVAAYRQRSVEPTVLVHMTSALNPGAFSFAGLCMDGEHDLSEAKYDYMDYYPLVSVEAFAAGAWGGNPGWLTKIHDPALLAGTKATRTCMALLKLFDLWICAQNNNLAVSNAFRAIEATFGSAASDCTFTGYWEEAARALWPLPPGLKASHYRRPGKGALLYVSNFLPTRAAVPIRVDWATLGAERGTVVDAETGQEIREQDLAVESHDLRVVLLRPAGR